MPDEIATSQDDVGGSTAGGATSMEGSAGKSVPLPGTSEREDAAPSTETPEARADGAALEGDAVALQLKPAIVAAGYGAIRVMSFDGGKTWKNRVVLNPNGGDDNNLIRAINYVEGVWVAAGWKIFLSQDGANWTEVSDRTVPGGWYDCVTAKDGRIIVKVIRSDRGGQNGEAIYSDDRGKTWNKATFATQCSAQPQPFAVDGATLRGQWKGLIQRSAAGGNWQTVFNDCCAISGFAKGMAVEN